MPKKKDLSSMSLDEKRLFFAGGRVTVGTITQMVDTTPGKAKFVKSYVAKVRGRIISRNDKYKYETPEQARAAGIESLKEWQALSTGSNTA